MNNNSIPFTLFKNQRIGEEYRKYSHPSGLDVYIFPKNLSSSYAIFGTKYGSINNRFKFDDADEWITVPDGIAHFLEHKLFACEDGSDAFEHFSEFGADANAYTSHDKTCYLFSCTDNFEESLRELLTFVTHPYFTKESVESEIGIIAEEIKMYRDDPRDRCVKGMLEGLYKNHSVRRNICGSEQSISKITPELLYACYDAFYRLSNMVLVICGNVDDSECLSIVDECLADKSGDAKNVICENENLNENPEAYKHYVEQYMQVSKPRFKIGFKDTDISPDPAERMRKEAAISILSQMVFSSSGELYASLIEKDMISPGMGFSYNFSDSFSFYSVTGQADDPQAVTDEILAYVEMLKRKGLSYEDFIRSKRVKYSVSVKAFDSTEEIANDMFDFICDGYDMLSYTDLLESISFEEVNDILNKMFDKKAMTLSVVFPLDKKIRRTDKHVKSVYSFFSGIEHSRN